MTFHLFQKGKSRLDKMESEAHFFPNWKVEESMTISSDEASQALAALQRSNGRLAQAADCPPSRHLAFALVMGALVSLPGFPLRMILVLELLIFLAIGLIFLWDRRRTGMFINGYRRGKTRALTLAMLGLFLAMVAIGALGKAENFAWAPFAMGVLAMILAYRCSVHWQKLFRRELGVDQ